MTFPQALGLQRPDLWRTQAYIAGDWIDAPSGATLAVNNPATSEVIATVPALGGDETAQAVAAADAALPDWSKRTAKERSTILRKLRDLMMTHQEDLARIMTAEQGKPLAESRGEIAYAAGFIEWFAEEAKRVYGDLIPAPFPGKKIMVMKQPVGVCAAITPWNFPAAMITRKLAPALAAGCTMVIKPADLTPLSALALCVLAEEAGVPPGVISVVTGEPKGIGAELTGNPIVRKLSFTGSTAVGRLLMSQCADHVKKVSLELGGNAPFIVFDDADVDAAVAGAIAAKFRNAGQTCVCTNRFLVQSGIHDTFVEKLSAATAALKVGNGLEDGTEIGPLITPSAVEKVEMHIADAVSRGAAIATGGVRNDNGELFMQPTVVTGATADMRLAQEETFGPLAPVFKFDAEEEAIELGNDTIFGLAAYLYTQDLGKAWRVTEALDYGIVGLNEGIISTEVAPFGGMKQSGLGREGSKYGIDDYLELKYVLVGGLGL